MTEPFMMPSVNTPPDGTYFVNTRVEFKDPAKKLILIPMDTRIMSGERTLYTKQECDADPSIWKTAIENTAQIGLRISPDNDLVSLRSVKKAGTPCAAVLLLPGKNRRARLMALVSEKLKQEHMPPAQEHYFMFVTPDEILLADKSKLKPSVIRKAMRNIRNRLASTDPGLLLSTEVLEYDTDEDVYREI